VWGHCVEKRRQTRAGITEEGQTRTPHVHSLDIQRVEVRVGVVPALYQAVTDAAHSNTECSVRAENGSVTACNRGTHLNAVARYALLLSNEKRVHASVYSTWFTMDRWMEWMSGHTTPHHVKVSSQHCAGTQEDTQGETHG
jgi:hypothetical protein